LFIEGRGLTESVTLPGGIRQVRVNLHNAGFGIKTGDFPAPALWFAHSNGYARFNTEAGFLDITARTFHQCGIWKGLPRLWLDLPQSYREQRIEAVDIRARGAVEVHGLTVDEVSVETWDDVQLVGLHIGSSCLAKSIRENVHARRVDASEDCDPRYPSVELSALAGAVAVTDSHGVWRLTGRDIDSSGATGPQQLTFMTPLGQPQPQPV
jgi:hypothetical protein